MTKADCADDLALIKNPRAQAEFLDHSLMKTLEVIDLLVNENKTEYLYLKPSKRQGDWFTYIGSNISSTEININVCLLKAQNDIYRLSIIWISSLSDKTKEITSKLSLCQHY